MSALSANANTFQILSESSDHLTLRMFMFQNAAGNLSSQLVVNAETLTYRTQILAYNNALARFVSGDVIRDTSNNSGAQATVCYNVAPTDDVNAYPQIVVTAISGNVTGFAAGDIIHGNREGSGTATVEIVDDPRRVLSIDSVLWSVQGPNASVALECSNGSAFDTMFMFSGQGYYGRNELDAPIGPNLPDSNGDVYVSTYAVPASGGFSLTVTFRKTQGYASPPGY
jgi:hypothetical protein